MKTEAKKAQEFTIKGELIGTINLTDTFQKVKEITNHKDSHQFLFIDKNREEIPRFELDRASDANFPIEVIKLFRFVKEEDPLFD